MVDPVVSIVVSMVEAAGNSVAGNSGLTVTALGSSAEAAFSDRKSDVLRIWDFDGFDSTALLGIEGHPLRALWRARKNVTICRMHWRRWMKGNASQGHERVQFTGCIHFYIECMSGSEHPSAAV